MKTDGGGKVKEVRVLAATGMLGSGFRESSLQRGLEMNPDFIGSDAGSTDSGPYFLATGTPHFSDKAVERDLRLLLLAARSKKIPLIIGSAGTSGADACVDHLVEMVTKIAGEEDLNFKLAAIYSEQSKDYLLERLRNKRVDPLYATTTPLTEEIIERSIRIVGMAGPEPFIEALEGGADVVIAGRSSDTSIYASLAVMRGINPATAWHAAKILECGAASVKQRKYPDCLFGVLRDDEFIIEPPNPDYACSPLSVASHNLYENGSPYVLREPSGTLFTDACRYEAVSDRAVRVSGGRFEEAADYSIKLEGVELAGYMSLFFGAVRDPMILKQLDLWLSGLMDTLHRRFEEIFGPEVRDRYSINIRRYGVNGAMGVLEPTPEVGHEVGLVFEFLADDPELASNMAKSAGHIAVHYPIPEWSGLITGLAYPYSPAELHRGPVYKFNMNHIVYPDSSRDMFRLEYHDVDARQPEGVK